MSIVNPVLEAHAGMSLFLEKVAKITHPIWNDTYSSGLEVDTGVR